MMQVLHWSFSPVFARYYSDSIKATGRQPSFGYIDDVHVPEIQHLGAVHLPKPGEPAFSVLLRRDLEQDVAEVSAAHEIAHELMQVKGFPMVVSMPEYMSFLGPIASLYSGVISHLWIRDHLRQYGLCEKTVISKKVDMWLTWLSAPDWREPLRHNVQFECDALYILDIAQNASSQDWSRLEPVARQKAFGLLEWALARKQELESCEPGDLESHWTHLAKIVSKSALRRGMCLVNYITQRTRDFGWPTD